MKRKLSPWCKAVKIAMIQKDWGVADLAQAVKMTKEYTSAVINRVLVAWVQNEAVIIDVIVSS